MTRHAQIGSCQAVTWSNLHTQFHKCKLVMVKSLFEVFSNQEGHHSSCTHHAYWLGQLPVSQIALIMQTSSMSKILLNKYCNNANNYKIRLMDSLWAPPSTPGVQLSGEKSRKSLNIGSDGQSRTSNKVCFCSGFLGWVKCTVCHVYFKRTASPQT